MSQPIAATCPHCRAQFAIQDPRIIGQQVACPGCAQPFVVSAGPVAPAPQPQQPFGQQPQQAAQQPQQPAGFAPQADPLAGGADPFAADPFAADPFAADPLGGGAADPFASNAPMAGAPASNLGSRPAYPQKQGGGAAKYKEPALIGGGVLLGLLLLFGLISLLMNGSASRGGDGNVVNMTWLPADTEMLTFVDVKAIVRSAMVREQMAENPEAAKQLEEMEQQLGVSIADVESLTLGGTEQNMLGVIRLSKDFDPANIPDAEAKTVGDVTMHVVNRMAVYAPDPRTVVIGEEGSIVAAADKGPAKQRFEKFDFVDAGQDMFFSYVPNDIQQLRSKMQGQMPPIPATAVEGGAEAMAAVRDHLRAIAGGGSIRGGNLSVSLQANLDDSSASSDLRSGLTSAISEGRKQYDAMKGMFAAAQPDAIKIADKMINSLSVKRSGESVALSLTFPAKDIQEMTEKQGMGGAPSMGMPMGFPGMGGLKNPLDGLGNFGGLFGGNRGGGMGGSGSGGGFGSNDLGVASNLKQIALAHHNFHDVYKSLPPAAGKGTGLSWRVHLLPYLEQAPLYNRFNLNEPWDSPTNKALIPMMPDVFKVPGVSTPAGQTMIQGLANAGSVFQSTEKGTRLRDIKDGTSNTALVVVANRSQAVEWTKPQDLNYSSPVSLQPFGQGYAAVMCDGSFRWIATSFSQWNFLINMSDGNPISLR